MRELPRLFSYDPGLTLTHFYAKVKFGHFGMGKVKIIFFFPEMIAALGLKVSQSIQLNELS